MMMVAMSRVWTSTARQSSRQTQQIAVCAARSMRSLLRKYTGDHDGEDGGDKKRLYDVLSGSQNFPPLLRGFKNKMSSTHLKG